MSLGLSLRQFQAPELDRSLCLQIRMKAENLIMYGMIDGDRKPKSLAAYLDLLVGDLLNLFEEGVRTYDAATGEVFTCKVILLASVQDYVGYRDVGLQRVSGET